MNSLATLLPYFERLDGSRKDDWLSKAEVLAELLAEKLKGQTVIRLMLLRNSRVQGILERILKHNPVAGKKLQDVLTVQEVRGEKAA
jgi:hypothetical protein